MSGGAILTGEQSEGIELLENKRPRIGRTNWRLVSGVIWLTKSFGNIIKRPERDPLEVNATVLARLERNPKLIEELGGLEGLAVSLGTDLENGMTAGGIALQREKYGSNSSEDPRKSLLHFARRAIIDREVVITAVCGLVSIGVGIPADGWAKGAKEGGGILGAVLIAVFFMVGSERWRNKLLVSSQDVEINVVREGTLQQVPVSNIVVGDVVLLKSGDLVPGNGLVLEEHSLKLNIQTENSTNQRFLLSGMLVVAGFGRMLVTAVGMVAPVPLSSQTSEDDENVQHQTKALESIITVVSYLLLLVYLLLVVIRRNDTFSGLHGIAKIKAIVEILVLIILTIINIPNPWVLSSVLTKAYSMKKLRDENHANVFEPSAIETMSYVTVICTDKTGVVETNQIKVTKFWQPCQEFDGERLTVPNVADLLRKGIALNTSGCVCRHPNSPSEFEIFGSPQEKAIFSWAVGELKTNVERIRTSHKIIGIQATDSYRSIMANENANGAAHVHMKGSPESVLAKCLSYYDVSGGIKNIDQNRMRSRFEEIVRDMEENGLTCVALAHKRVRAEEIEADKLGRLQEDLILIGVVGISNPCLEGAKKAARDCRTAGVKLKLITEDNIFTAKSIAEECGILAEEDIEHQVIRGRDFENYSEDERMERVDNISVLAEASPSNKLLMVQCLKRRGHVVAIAGEFTSSEDADVSIATRARGGSGAHILISHRGLPSVVQALRWGRCFYRNMQKFIQFQLTAKFVFLAVNFYSVIYWKDIPLTAFQILWLSLVTDTLGALAFSTVKPSGEVLERPPEITGSLVTNPMLRNVLIQIVYHTAVLVFFLDRGNFSESFLFNLFVLFRVFGGLSARELKAKNVFHRRLHRNGIFLGVFGFSVALQVVLVQFLHKVADTERLSWSEWGLSTAFVFATLPIGWLARLVPVPRKQVFGYWLQLLRIKSRLQRLVLRKLRSLSVWASIMLLIGLRKREQPRSGVCV